MNSKLEALRLARIEAKDALAAMSRLGNPDPDYEDDPKDIAKALSRLWEADANLRYYLGIKNRAAALADELDALAGRLREI